MTTDPTLVERRARLSALRRAAAEIFAAGVRAADPYHAVKKALCSNGTTLEILPDSRAEAGAGRTAPWSKVHLVAFGKAACAMASAAVEIIPQRLLAGRGIVVTNYENVTDVARCDVHGAGHPLPDAAGHSSAKAIADRVAEAKAGELVLVLISGGGSALVPYPAESVSLNEKIATTRLLLACGADITQINCVRKHLSRLKGGGLARLAHPADVHALVLSDVLGDDLSAIASGPTIPDGTTFADAMRVFESKGVWGQVPQNVRRHLEAGRQGLIPETPKPGDPIFDRVGHTLVGSNRISVDAIVEAAKAKGCAPHLYSDALCGEARDEAAKFVRHAKQCLTAQPGDKPIAFLAGGETTVTVKGQGRGGRNQELALAFALSTEALGLAGDWVFLSGGTDGRDGPTDAAGAIVDPLSLERMRHAGIEPAARLDDNDAYAALKAARDLLDTGATGTNVADLQVLLVDPETHRNDTTHH